MSSFKNRKTILASLLVLATGAFTVPVSAESVTADAVSVRASNLGVIKGIVRDRAGSAIADATVAIFRAGTSQLIKQVSSAADGSFIAKVVPGRYTVLAVAEGFNPISLSQVDVNRSAELYYGFNLERAGSGNTLPEKRADRNNSKWRIRAATLQRSIYQNTDGDAPVDESATSADVDSSVEVSTPDDDTAGSGRRTQTAVETYFAGTGDGNYAGVNFATMFPAGAKATVVLAGQAGSGSGAPQRLEASVKYRSGRDHQLKLTSSAGKLGTFAADGRELPLG
ncbi:MAG TPA: carboxypeptidase regulatory-like domain-containing protein, partial [Pyrinomonadaceae bacterium]|nr:carboxypeptidase regulatory-like domain-containing protein [Pyrinomonadaceae bacterium]